MMTRIFQSVSWQFLFIGSIVGVLWPGVLTPAQAVVISEFLAYNDSGVLAEEGELLDEDGQASDWVELFSMASGAGAQTQSATGLANAARARLVEIRAIDSSFPL